jgi:hypothetical protein
VKGINETIVSSLSTVQENETEWITVQENEQPIEQENDNAIDHAKE